MNKENEKKEYEKIERNGTIELFGTELNVYGTFEDPYFMAKEVAEWIDYNTYVNKEKGIRNISKMLKPIDEDYKEKFEILCDIPESNTTSTSSSKARKTQVMLFISEDGLYDLLSASRNKKAKKFRTEVRKILKKIRKENKELVFGENSVLKNENMKMRKMLIDKLRMENGLAEALKIEHEVHDKRAMSLTDFIIKYDLNMTENELKDRLVSLDLLDGNYKIKEKLIGGKYPVLKYLPKNGSLIYVELYFSYAGAIYTRAILNLKDKYTDEEKEFIYCKKEKKQKKNKKKDEKVIKAVDYIDNLEEKEKEKREDEIRHVRVKRIK